MTDTEVQPAMRRYVDFDPERFPDIWERMVAAVLHDPGFRAAYQTVPYEQQMVEASRAIEQVIAFLVVHTNAPTYQLGLPSMLNAVWGVLRRDFTQWYVAFSRHHGKDYIHYTARPTFIDASSDDVEGERLIQRARNFFQGHPLLLSIYRPEMWTGRCAGAVVLCP